MTEPIINVLKGLTSTIQANVHEFGRQSLACPHRYELRCDHKLNNTDTCEYLFCRLSEEDP
jgi:hypothetical protein